MNVTYKRKQSMSEFFKIGESFKKGQIIPRRILACGNKKQQHLLKFGGNCLAIPIKIGYLVHAENNDGDFVSAVKIEYWKGPGKQCFDFYGSIYSKPGETLILGNHLLDPIETLHNLNDRYMRMNGAKNGK